MMAGHIDGGEERGLIIMTRGANLWKKKKMSITNPANKLKRGDKQQSLMFPM